MASIESLTLWNDGVKLMEKKDYATAIETFKKVPERSAKVLFNTCMCTIIQGNVERSLTLAEEVLSRDEHMAVGYYLRGIINYKLNRIAESCKDFETSHTKLRGRNVIDYNQLGLKYKLYACECLHNVGISHAVLGDRARAIDYLWQASRCKAEKRHDVVDKAIASVDSGSRADIMEVPYPDMIYRPAKAKMANLQKKDYLGKAKVVTAIEGNDIKPGFEAPRKISQGLLTVDPNNTAKSAPNSPNAERKSNQKLRPNSREDRRPSLLDMVGEGAAKLKQLLPGGSSSGGLKPSKSDSNIVGNNNNTKAKSPKGNSLPPPPNKPLPPPPNKQAPVLPVGVGRKSKPLPQPPSPELAAFTQLDEGEEYSYAEETNRLAERLEKLHQAERNKENKHRVNENCVDDEIHPVKPSEILKSQKASPPRANEEDVTAYPPLPPRKSPPYNLPPKPPAKKSTETLVNVQLTCTDTISLQLAKNSSLESIMEKAGKQFHLEPGTFNIWYQRASDEEFVCVEAEDNMTRLWAGVKDNLSLWCFSMD